MHLSATGDGASIYTKYIQYRIPSKGKIGTSLVYEPRSVTTEQDEFVSVIVWVTFDEGIVGVEQLRM